MSSEFLNQFCQHIVSLGGVDARIEPGADTDEESRWDTKQFCVSAFVLSVRGNWFLVTAGHILRELDERLKAGRRMIRSFLMDGTASGLELPPIPFVLGRTPQWYEYDEVEGMDYALIPLRDGFVAPLQAAGVVALNERACADITVAADHYYLLGFPEEATRMQSTRLGGTIHTTIEMGTPLLPIQRVDLPPAFMVSEWPRFYAKVPEHESNGGKSNGVPKSIVGMSGGPVFAFKRTSPASGKYWVIAVQSSWDSKSRTLAACPILPLVRFLEQRIDANEAA